jgi:hypothetical protein
MITHGIDPTMPQHRQDSAQSETFPCRYFFYGTLAIAEKLMCVLCLAEPPMFRTAFIRGYSKEKFGGLYALVPSHADSIVTGVSYEVSASDHARRLAEYETSAYNVEDCSISLEDGSTSEATTFVAGMVLLSDRNRVD